MSGIFVYRLDFQMTSGPSLRKGTESKDDTTKRYVPMLSSLL